MHIFISYAKQDAKELALKIHDTLNNIPGVTAWMDASLETANSWASQIQKEIDCCDCMVVLISEDVNRTNRRSFVLNEIDYAQQDHKKAIIPVLVHDTKVPVQIAGIQYIDFVVDQEDGIEKLVTDINNRLMTAQSGSQENVVKDKLSDYSIKGLLVEKQISARDKSYLAKKDPIKANRAELLKAVDQIWLSGLLDHLLNQQESLKIDLEALEPDKLAQSFGGQPYPLTDNQAVLKAFDDFGRKLVLLGQPGAGKTVLMLQLARLLRDAAQNDERERIPIIFPLASWAAKQLPLEQWLGDELHNRYGAPKKLAKALVESEQVIFLLDGLDEVAEDYREDCLKAIKAFVENQNRHVEYVVCSRRKEFKELQTRLNVPGEIVLQPLTMKQVRSYLKKEPFAALLGLLNTNDIVRNQFSAIPFMVNTMAYVTRGESDDGLRRLLAGKDTVESLRAAFLDDYVTQRLAEKPNDRYSNANTRHWLRWLAGQLIRHDETDFYLENMQPDWLANSAQEQRWRQANRLVVGLLGGLLFGLGGGLGIGLLFGLMVGLGVGLAVWLGSGSVSRIKMSDQLRWNFTKSTVLAGLEGGLLFGLLFGLNGRLGVGLLFGLLFGLVVGLVVGLDSHSMLRYRIKPGQGLQRSLMNGVIIILVVGLMVGLVGMLVGMLVSGLLLGLGIGLMYGLMGGLKGGLGIFIQHYILRWMLAHEGNLPFRRYDKFLDYANDLVILRKVGGGYRFTHDMLRQHLSGASVPKVDS